MEWKFRKEFQVMPGVKLQYGSKGIRTEFTTPDLPEQEKIDVEKLKHQLFKPYDAAHEIKSMATGTMTSESLQPLKAVLLASDKAFHETNTLLKEKTAQFASSSAKAQRLEKSFFKFLFKTKIQNLHRQLAALGPEIEELKQQKELSVIHLEIDTQDEYNRLFNNIWKAFDLLTTARKKWDFTSAKRNNMVAERTSASQSITRSEISISPKGLPILISASPALCFHNMNGGDLYFYPGFLVVYESKQQFDLISYSDIDILFHQLRFIENETVPADAEVVGKTWHKVNKDGSPDRRFAQNFQIPIVLYGEIKFKSVSGLNEVYCFSHVAYSSLFAKAITDYADALKTAEHLLHQFR